MEDYEKKIIEMFSEISKLHGLSKSIGAIYAVLFLSDEPLSIPDIVEKLKISKGNVSMGLKKLEELGFIRKVMVIGKRRNYYVVEDRFSSIKDIAKKKYEIISKTYESVKDSKLPKDKLKKLEKMKNLSEKILKVLEEINNEENI
ncbi:hypothetical protein J422_02424 [Methanocaldococcus villosus KIN24-T80]|uniref:HTH arsR-type domain-containing protein n=1 Tax=Methanocaldococcus villosus KIN24-T80 TaxID=1069083 RepID=N6V2A0_9EURY|nr:MarR family transcriptional regulator [Methanocaldococcus villosus]ENN96398.1 hypothetical protein J422_02424 [Methanocaldococcus villosus KIN24-T80]